MPKETFLHHFVLFIKLVLNAIVKNSIIIIN